MVGIVSSGVLAAMRDFVDASKVPLIVANAGNDEATGETLQQIYRPGVVLQRPGQPADGQMDV